MPATSLARFLTYPEMKLLGHKQQGGTAIIEVEKTSPFEVCPKCATPSHAVYDRRWATVRDAPVRGRGFRLLIRKRRFSCKPCRKPFTEPVAGISKGARTTERFRKQLLWACERFSDLKAVRQEMSCSYSMIYKTLYEQLSRKVNERRYVWPQRLGLDEHRFKRHPRLGFTQFVTVVCDHSHRRVMELVDGRSVVELEETLRKIPGRENVAYVSQDLSTTYRSFVTSFFPNAKIVADKFHVLRLLHPAINRERKAITGDKRTLPVRKLLLRNGKDVDFMTRARLLRWLEEHPRLKELYHFKEAMHGLYRIRGQKRARRAFTALTDRMAQSQLPEIKTLRKTLLSWRTEILNYFEERLTNARVEGFNGKAKLIKRRGYGYRSFKNYRLRVLNACT